MAMASSSVKLMKSGGWGVGRGGPTSQRYQQQLYPVSDDVSIALQA
jgi:hypothetical protein